MDLEFSEREAIDAILGGNASLLIYKAASLEELHRVKANGRAARYTEVDFDSRSVSEYSTMTKFETKLLTAYMERNDR